MPKNLFDQFSPFLFMGVMVLLIAAAAHYVWSIFNPSTDFSAEDPQAIARYKEWIANNDLPFAGGKIKPEDLPLVYRKVIEYDVRTGDLKAARGSIAEVIHRKLDTQVLELAQLPEAKELINHVQNGARKVEALKQIVATLDKGQGKQDSAEKVEAELARLCGEFTKMPFNPTACPEQAAEMAQICKSSLLPSRDKSAAVKQISTEIERW
jgi:hypothetical protein